MLRTRRYVARFTLKVQRNKLFLLLGNEHNLASLSWYAEPDYVEARLFRPCCRARYSCMYLLKIVAYEILSNDYFVVGTFPNYLAGILDHYSPP